MTFLTAYVLSQTQASTKESSLAGYRR